MRGMLFQNKKNKSRKLAEIKGITDTHLNQIYTYICDTSKKTFQFKNRKNSLNQISDANSSWKREVSSNISILLLMNKHFEK